MKSTKKALRESIRAHKSWKCTRKLKMVEYNLLQSLQVSFFRLNKWTMDDGYKCFILKRGNRGEKQWILMSLLPSPRCLVVLFLFSKKRKFETKVRIIKGWEWEEDEALFSFFHGLRLFFSFSNCFLLFFSCWYGQEIKRAGTRDEVHF